MLYVFVGIGGIIGAVFRYLLGTWAGGHGALAFPYSTLLINLLGCFILAFFYTITTNRFPVHPHFRAAFGTGFVGSFTTFSTFSYETLALLQGGRFLPAVLYVIASLLGGYVFALLGVRLGNGRKKRNSTGRR